MSHSVLKNTCERSLLNYEPDKCIFLPVIYINNEIVMFIIHVLGTGSLRRVYKNFIFSNGNPEKIERKLFSIRISVLNDFVEVLITELKMY
jgi:hypothetical protein